MKVLVILAHPDKASLNHAIAAAAMAQLRRNGHQVLCHDLYREKFDGILRAAEIPQGVLLPEAIADHCRELVTADGIIVVHPNWWGQPPAILKGWIDRVFRAGVAYKFLEGDKGEGVPVGLLKIRMAVVFNTANTPTAREKKMFGDPLQLIWKNCIFNLCGVAGFERKVFAVVVTSTPTQRRQWLREVAETVNRCFPRRTAKR
jgi:putative NADPH-quinone reductase